MNFVMGKEYRIVADTIYGSDFFGKIVTLASPVVHNGHKTGAFLSCGDVKIDHYYDSADNWCLFFTDIETFLEEV